MGVNGLLAFLRKKYPNACQSSDLSQFRNKKFSIDITGFIYKYKAVNPKRWLDSFIYLLCAFRRNEIYPLFIFDGEAPAEKKDEQLRRVGQRQKLEDYHRDLSQALDLFYETGEVKDVLNTEMKKIKDKSPLEQDMNIFNPKLIESRVQKIDNQIIRIDEEDIFNIIQIITLMGYHYYQPLKGEAEAVAAYLANKGIVHGVISNDSDVLAYDVPLFIYDLNPFTEKLTMYDKAHVLSEIGLTSNEFTDFCIMCGTDYNDNIPKVGPVNSLKLIHEHKSIDNIDHPGKPILKHEVSRKIFNEFQSFNHDIIPPSVNTIKLTELQNFMTTRNSHVSIESIKELWFPAVPVELELEPDVSE